jgi:Luciferase-like monooxygenase
MSCGHHEAAWRLPESDPSASLDLSYWTNLARIAERGTFDSVFLADGPALWGHARFRPGGALEPTVLLTALAGATSRIGLVIPLLRKGGVFRTEYTGRTLREHYGIPRPENQFTTAARGGLVPA